MFKSPASNLPSWKQLSKELARWAQVGREGGKMGKGHERRKTFEDHFSISNDLRQRVLFRISLLTLPGRTDESVSLQFILATTHWNLNTAQAVHIFVLVHVKQVCQVFPAPTPRMCCANEMKLHQVSCPQTSISKEIPRTFVCVSYILLFRQGLQWSWGAQSLTNSWAEKLGVHQHFRRLGTWHGWNEATNLTDWCEQAGISDYLYTYTPYFFFEQYAWKSVITCYLIGHGSKSSYNPNVSQQMKDWGTKDFQVKSVALLIP